MSKRIVKAPKFYIRDTGLLHFLHRIWDFESLLGHPIIGASWEGYVIEQIILEAPEFSDFYYYRTQNGAEIDLLIITPNGNRIAIEIKHSMTPNLARGFHEAIKDTQPVKSYVITPSGDFYERVPGIWICPLSTFLEEVLPNID